MCEVLSELPWTDPRRTAKIPPKSPDPSQEQILDFLEDLKKTLSEILETQIQPPYGEDPIALEDPLPKFSGSLYVSRIDRIQNILLTAVTVGKYAQSLLTILKPLNHSRLKFLDEIYKPGAWYQDGQVIQKAFWSLLIRTIEKYPNDLLLQRWWIQNQRQIPWTPKND